MLFNIQMDPFFEGLGSFLVVGEDPLSTKTQLKSHK